MASSKFFPLLDNDGGDIGSVVGQRGHRSKRIFLLPRTPIRGISAFFQNSSSDIDAQFC